MSLSQVKTEIQCTECARNFNYPEDGLKVGDKCPSDDCPSNEQVYFLILKRISQEALGNGISGLGVSAALNAMAEYWKNNLVQGEHAKRIEADLSELILDLTNIRKDIQSKIDEEVSNPKAPHIRVEWDPAFWGGDYSGVGQFLLIPITMINEAPANGVSSDDVVQFCFKKLTHQDSAHIIHYSEDELFDQFGNPIEDEIVITSIDKIMIQENSSSIELGKIGYVMVPELVDDYDTPATVPEWEWIERVSSFAHNHNAQDGVWEFMINLSCEERFVDTPEKLKPVIAEARRKNLAYLIFHQGT